MLNYIASPVLQLLVTLLVITVLVFAMLRLIPGDPAMVIAGTEATMFLPSGQRVSSWHTGRSAARVECHGRAFVIGASVFG